MTVKMNGLFSSLRTAWTDVMPMGKGMSFTTQDFLEDRVSDLERENQQLRALLAQSHIEFPSNACFAGVGD